MGLDCSLHVFQKKEKVTPGQAGAGSAVSPPPRPVLTFLSHLLELTEHRLGPPQSCRNHHPLPHLLLAEAQPHRELTGTNWGGDGCRAKPTAALHLTGANGVRWGLWPNPQGLRAQPQLLNKNLTMSPPPLQVTSQHEGTPLWAQSPSKTHPEHGKGASLDPSTGCPAQEEPHWMGWTQEAAQNPKL